MKQYKNYKLHLSHKEMKDLGFHYDFGIEDYVYEFPVYRLNGKTQIVCKLGVDEETNQIWFNVYDTNHNLYPSYYNRTYGKSKIVPIIEKNIRLEIGKLKEKEKEINGDD